MKYDYIKQVNSDKLEKELKATAFGDKIDHVDTNFSVGSVSIFTSSDLLVDEKLIVDTVVTTHNTMDIQAVVEAAIRKAQAFGNSIMVEYGASNVIAGKSIADIGVISGRLATVQQLLSSGSLYVALAELDNITIDSLVSQADIDYVKGRLQTYLGL